MTPFYKAILSAIPFAVLSTASAAQSVNNCDWEASAQSIVEPWEDNTATFANGAVRLVNLDTIEPAVGFAYVLVLSPPYDELGSRVCKVIGSADGLGFAGLGWETLAAEYDPKRGLVFDIAVSLYEPDSSAFVPQNLNFSVNQATGEVAASLGPLAP